MSADPDRIAEARRVLAALGVSTADLEQRPPVPTLDEYLPRIMGAVGPGMLRTYRPYWNRLSVAFGTRRLNTITATEIEDLEYRVAANAAQRSSNRYGRSARESFIAAARAIYSRAIADDLLPAGSSPAHRVSKPRRLPSTRRALTATELEQINTVARSSGTTRSWMHCCCGYTPKPPAAAAVPSCCECVISTPRSAWCDYGKRDRPSDGSRSAHH